MYKIDEQRWDLGGFSLPEYSLDGWLNGIEGTELHEHLMDTLPSEPSTFAVLCTAGLILRLARPSGVASMTQILKDSGAFYPTQRVNRWCQQLRTHEDVVECIVESIYTAMNGIVVDRLDLATRHQRDAIESVARTIELFTDKNSANGTRKHSITNKTLRKASTRQHIIKQLQSLDETARGLVTDDVVYEDDLLWWVRWREPGAWWARGCVGDDASVNFATMLSVF